MKKQTAERAAAALAARTGRDYADLARAFVLPEEHLKPRAGLAVDFPHDLTPSGIGHGVILDVTDRQILVRTALDAAPVWIPISMTVTEGQEKAEALRHRAVYTVELSYTPRERAVRLANLDQVAGALAAVLASYADYSQAPVAAAPAATEQLALF